MAIAYRSSAKGDTNGGAATTVTVNKPTGTVDGDILIAFVGQRLAAGGTIAAPGGWTQLGGQTNGTGVGVARFWKRASGEGASYVFTLGASATHGGCIIVCISGAVASGSPIGAHGATTTALSTTVNVPALTMAAANAILLAHGALARGTTTLTPNNGYTGVNTTDSGGTTSGLREHVAHLASSGANPAAMTMTCGGAFNNAGQHVAVLEAPATTVGRSFAAVIT